MKTASVSELKAHLAHYLRLARRGTEVQILERGVPIARLVTAAAGDEWVERLVGSGHMRRGTADWSWLVEEAPLAVAGANQGRALDEQREERS